VLNDKIAIGDHLPVLAGVTGLTALTAPGLLLGPLLACVRRVARRRQRAVTRGPARLALKLLNACDQRPVITNNRVANDQASLPGTTSFWRIVRRVGSDRRNNLYMQCIRVGYGVIARVHERKFRELGIGTAAVVDIDARRRAQATQDGHIVRASCAAAVDLRADFWDVCVDSGAHLAVLREIVSLDPQARILLEKPICQHREIAELRALLAGFQGRLTVNENYSSSSITSIVRTTAFDTLRLTVRGVVVEMSKSRIGDFEAGRFVDYEAGALRYEGPHMLAILDDLGPGWAPTRIERVECDDALVELRSGVVPLFGQGIADVSCEARCGVPVGLFTSMSGAIKFPYPPYGMSGIARDDTRTRYRIVAVDGVDADGGGCSVVGFFEPVAALARGQGAVAVIRDGREA
jgi:hypothetical protein